jgi:hypothetical protein
MAAAEVSRAAVRAKVRGFPPFRARRRAPSVEHIGEAIAGPQGVKGAPDDTG